MAVPDACRLATDIIIITQHLPCLDSTVASVKWDWLDWIDEVVFGALKLTTQSNEQRGVGLVAAGLIPGWQC